MVLNSKNILILGIIAFLVMSIWSLSTMCMDMNGHMVNCPFMNGSTGFCQMTLTEHMSLWQQTFSLIKIKDLFLLSLLILLFSVLYATIGKTYYQLKSQPFRHYFYKYRPEIKLFDHLALAFSDGLIHSKIYA
jgi:hypothetical protein